MHCRSLSTKQTLQEGRRDGQVKFWWILFQARDLNGGWVVTKSLDKASSSIRTRRCSQDTNQFLTNSSQCQFISVLFAPKKISHLIFKRDTKHKAVSLGREDTEQVYNPHMNEHIHKRIQSSILFFRTLDITYAYHVFCPEFLRKKQPFYNYTESSINGIVKPSLCKKDLSFTRLESCIGSSRKSVILSTKLDYLDSVFCLQAMGNSYFLHLQAIESIIQFDRIMLAIQPC